MSFEETTASRFNEIKVALCAWDLVGCLLFSNLFRNNEDQSQSSKYSKSKPAIFGISIRENWIYGQ